MAVVDGGVILAADINAALGLIAPSKVLLGANITPGVTRADVPGLSITVTVGGPSEVYEAIIAMEARKSAATQSLLQVRLVVDGVSQSGSIAEDSTATVSRLTTSRPWPVITGLAAGSRVFKVQASQTVASQWVLIAGGQTLLSVKRVG